MRKIIFSLIILIGIISITVGTYLIFSLNKEKTREEAPITYDLKCEKEIYNLIYNTTIKITANYSTNNDEVLSSKIVANIIKGEETKEEYLVNLYNEYTTLYKDKEGYPVYKIKLNNNLLIEEITDYKKVKNIPDQIFRDFINTPHLNLEQSKSELLEELESFKFVCN